MAEIREGWSDWIATVRQRIARGQLECAAHMLICCGPNPSMWTEEDYSGYRDMFTLPEVLANAQALWRHMRTEITPGHVLDVFSEVRGCGWNIVPASK